MRHLTLATLPSAATRQYDEFAKCHTADLNVVMCHRSINYMAEMMENKYGIPWIKVNFIGGGMRPPSRCARSPSIFDDESSKHSVEKVIAARNARR